MSIAYLIGDDIVSFQKAQLASGKGSILNYDCNIYLKHQRSGVGWVS